MASGVFKAPASIANIGPGYDVFSMALDRPYITVDLTVDDGDEIIITNKGRYAALMSSKPEENTGSKAVKNLLQKKGLRKRVEIVFYAEIPPRKGLGASGAEAAACVFGLSKLLGLKLATDELISLSAAVEPGGHPDNVAASILGGFVTCIRENGLTFCKITPPEDLGIIIIVPDIEKESTMVARRFIPETLSLKTHLEVTSRVGTAALALASGQVDIFLKAISYDPFVEYFRADAGLYGKGVNGEKLMMEKRRLFKEFKVAEVISGAGPSRALFFKLSENKDPPGSRPVDMAVAEVIDTFERNGNRVLEIFETRPNHTGCIQIA